MVELPRTLNRHIMISLILILFFYGCAVPQIKLFSDETDPLQEFVIEGEKKDKILVISIDGFISDAPRQGLLRGAPSVVEETVSQLRMAEKDEAVKAILLKINSPGGTTTASDILYREIIDFKKRTGKKIVAGLMDVAASGGYYVALAADAIIAHPTTVTGSVGVIFLHPKISGLMHKIGVDVAVSKSGRNKDMGSPFRKTTEEEQQVFQRLIDELGDRFLSIVRKKRKIGQEALTRIGTARVFLADEAMELGLIDQIGYLSESLRKARELADLPDNCKVVIYRRTEHPDDTIYNTSTSRDFAQVPSMIDLGQLADVTGLRTGFYYLWPAAVSGQY